MSLISREKLSAAIGPRSASPSKEKSYTEQVEGTFKAGVVIMVALDVTE